MGEEERRVREFFGGRRAWGSRGCPRFALCSLSVWWVCAVALCLQHSDSVGLGSKGLNWQKASVRGATRLVYRQRVEERKGREGQQNGEEHLESSTVNLRRAAARNTELEIPRQRRDAFATSRILHDSLATPLLPLKQDQEQWKPKRASKEHRAPAPKPPSDPPTNPAIQDLQSATTKPFKGYVANTKLRPTSNQANNSPKQQREKGTNETG